MKYFLLALISFSGGVFAFFFLRDIYRKRKEFSKASWVPLLFIGFLADFLDTLGIGSFAVTTSFYKFTKIVNDRVIPGTLNAGHCLPTITEALIFITAVQVAPSTLISLMFAATLGAVLGAGAVAKMPVNKIRLGLGSALVLVVIAMLAGMFNIIPSGGNALGLVGWKLIVAVALTFCLGALQTIGIGLYAPCMALVSLMGMNPLAAYPIMMGSCALLMPWCSIRFVRTSAYDAKASFGLTALGIVGVLIAAFIVKKLPLDILRWVVIVVILYTSIVMFLSIRKKDTPATSSESCRS